MRLPRMIERLVLPLVLALGAADPAVRFLAVGDTGSLPMPGRQAEVAALMARVAAARPVDCVLLLGDNFYFSGVTSVDDPRWETTFENAYSQPSLRVPFLAT